jgi:hypothetical protein
LIKQSSIAISQLQPKLPRVVTYALFALARWPLPKRSQHPIKLGCDPAHLFLKDTHWFVRSDAVSGPEGLSTLPDSSHEVHRRSPSSHPRCVSTPGSPKTSIGLRMPILKHVPPVPFFTTSAVCATQRLAGLLHPARDHGVRPVLHRLGPKTRATLLRSVGPFEAFPSLTARKWSPARRPYTQIQCPPAVGPGSRPCVGTVLFPDPSTSRP